MMDDGTLFSMQDGTYGERRYIKLFTFGSMRPVLNVFMLWNVSIASSLSIQNDLNSFLSLNSQKLRKNKCSEVGTVGCVRT